MTAEEYIKTKNKMCEFYGDSCGAKCPLAYLCTPEDTRGREAEAVEAAERWKRLYEEEARNEPAGNKGTGNCL